MRPYLSIVIPAYNEEQRIVATLLKAVAFLSTKTYMSEIIVVDDGSCDETVTVVNRIIGDVKHPNVSLRCIQLKVNRGRGFAIRMGMISAQGSRSLLIDADASVPIETLDGFMNEMDRTDAHLLVGSLLHPFSTEIERTEFYRLPLRRFAWLVLRVLFRFPIRDTQRPFKLFNREAVHGIFYRCTIERFGIDIEVVAIATALGFKMKEMPIVWDNPAGSKVNLRSYWQTFIEALRVWKRQRTPAYRMTTLHYS